MFYYYYLIKEYKIWHNIFQFYSHTMKDDNNFDVMSKNVRKKWHLNYEWVFHYAGHVVEC
jgi:hypothetical protein